MPKRKTNPRPANGEAYYYTEDETGHYAMVYEAVTDEAGMLCESGPFASQRDAAKAHPIAYSHMTTSKRTSRRKKNPSALGWVGIGLGATAGLGLVLAGVVFYRLTKL